MADKVNITCIGCGKKTSIDVSSIPGNQTAAYACGCGATTQVEGSLKGGGGDTLKLLNDLLPKITPIIQQLRQTKMPGPDTGMGEALAQVAKELTLEVIEENPELRAMLKTYVEDSIRANLQQIEDMKGEGEEETEPQN